MPRLARLKALLPWLALGALALALAGYWAPWLTHPAAGLRLSGFDLAEWAMFLPGVLDGSLPLNRLDFLLPLACLALALSVAAARTRPSTKGWRRWVPGTPLGWALWALALACVGLVLPPYEILRDRQSWPEFQTQFVATGLTLLGVLACPLLPRPVNAGLQVAAALTGGGYGAWALWTVRPAASEVLNAPWAIGLGWGVMLAGWAGLAVTGALELWVSLPRHGTARDQGG